MRVFSDKNNRSLAADVEAQDGGSNRDGVEVVVCHQTLVFVISMSKPHSALIHRLNNKVFNACCVTTWQSRFTSLSSQIYLGIKTECALNNIILLQ